NRRLTGSRRADDRDRLPGLRLETEIRDEGLFRFVAEEHVLERHQAPTLTLPQRGRGNSDVIRNLLLGGEELEDPLGRCQARLQQVELAGKPGDRHRELARVLD